VNEEGNGPGQFEIILGHLPEETEEKNIKSADI
jgi:hypothetical protein